MVGKAQGSPAQQWPASGSPSRSWPPLVYQACWSASLMLEQMAELMARPPFTLITTLSISFFSFYR